MWLWAQSPEAVSYTHLKDPVQDKESSDEIGADNEETLKGEETEKTVASHKGSAFHLAVESLPVRITEQSQVGRVVAASKLYEELSPADKAMTAADDLKKLKDAQELSLIHILILHISFD